MLEGGDGHWAIELASVADGAATTDLVRFLLGNLGKERWVLWGRRPIGDEVAGRLGLGATRAIHQVSVDLPVGVPDLPEGVVVRGFRTGRDEDEWIRVNNAAFAGHPENGAVDRAELSRRMDQPWFEPNGLRMAWRGEVLEGSCWTKVHDSGEGEIYIIGIAPSAQGIGLGRALVLEGLRHLHEDRGASVGTLWVEADNRIALELYASIGFMTTQTISQYEPAAV